VIGGDDESKKFWEEREKDKGGKLGFFTFATYMGISSEKPVNTGGLLYTIDRKIYFEDFEKENRSGRKPSSASEATRSPSSSGCRRTARSTA
jgi:hypothetical protein